MQPQCGTWSKFFFLHLSIQFTLSRATRLRREKSMKISTIKILSILIIIIHQQVFDISLKWPWKSRKIIKRREKRFKLKKNRKSNENLLAILHLKAKVFYSKLIKFVGLFVFLFFIFYFYCFALLPALMMAFTCIFAAWMGELIDGCVKKRFKYFYSFTHRIGFKKINRLASR